MNDPGEDNSPEGSAKRKRISRACLQCRSRKVKCDGQLPMCSGCLHNGSQCQYSASKKRGLPPGYLMQLERYANRLEHILGRLMATVPNGSHNILLVVDGLAKTAYSGDGDRTWQQSSLFESVKGGDIVINPGSMALSPPEMSSGVQMSSIPAPSMNSADPRMPDAQKPVAVSQQPDMSFRPASGISQPESISPSYPQTPHVKPESVLSDSLLAPPTNVSVPAGYLGPTSGFTPDFRPLVPGTQLKSDASQWVRNIPITERIALLELYFTHVHSWLPMINKPGLTRTAYSTDSFDGDDGTSILLWAVVEYGVALDRRVGAVDGNKLPAYLATVSNGKGTTLEKVQALIILSLLFMSGGLWDSAWILTGAAVRAAMQIGLNTFSTNLCVFSKRTWYACCIVETLVSARVGRISHLSESSFEVEVLDEEGLEEWELWKPIVQPVPSASGVFDRSKGSSWLPEPARSLSVFNALFSLVRVLNSVINSVNQPQFVSKPKLHRTMFFTDISSRIQLWNRDLPEHCDLFDLPLKMDRPIAPNRVNLYLTFCLTLSLCHLYDDALTTAIGGCYYSGDTLPPTTSKLILSYATMFDPYFSPPAFEYSASVALRLVLYSAVRSNSPSKAWISEALPLLGFFKEIWPGASTISRQYFSQERFPILQYIVGQDSDKLPAASSLPGAPQGPPTLPDNRGLIEGNVGMTTEPKFASVAAPIDAPLDSQKQARNANERYEQTFAWDRIFGDVRSGRDGNPAFAEMSVPEFLHNLGFLNRP